jgi:hypothetical protein
MRIPMKKKIQTQPLQLSRETIRQLDNNKLAGIESVARRSPLHVSSSAVS